MIKHVNYKNPKYDGYQRGPASMVYKCFGRKPSDGSARSENMFKQELAE